MRTGLNARVFFQRLPKKNKENSPIRLYTEARGRGKASQFRVVLAWQGGGLALSKRQALLLTNMLVDLVENGEFDPIEAEEC